MDPIFTKFIVTYNFIGLCYQRGKALAILNKLSSSLANRNLGCKLK